MGTKTGMRICALFLAVFLLLGAVPMYNLNLTAVGEAPPADDLADVLTDENIEDGEDGGSLDEADDSVRYIITNIDFDGNTQITAPVGTALEDLALPETLNVEVIPANADSDTDTTPDGEEQTGDDTAATPNDGEQTGDDTAATPDGEEQTGDGTAATPDDGEQTGDDTATDTDDGEQAGDGTAANTDDDEEQAGELQYFLEQDGGQQTFTELVGVEWVCDDYNPMQFGEYVFTAVFPQDHVLGEGVALPQITVALYMPIMPFAGNFDVTYNNGAGSQSFSTFQAAWNFVNTLPAATSDIVITMNTNGFLDYNQYDDPLTLRRPCTIDGGGNTLTIYENSIYFQGDITFKNITLRHYNATNFVTIYVNSNNVAFYDAHIVGYLVDVKTLSVTNSDPANPSSIKLPSKLSNNYYISFRNYDPGQPPLTGDTLRLLTDTDKQTASSDYLIRFLSGFTNPDATSAQMILQIELGVNGGSGTGGYAPEMMARWVDESGTYRFDLHSPPVMLTYYTGATFNVKFFDYFDSGSGSPNAVDFVNSLTGAHDITISLRVNGLTSTGDLPNKLCTITSDSYNNEIYTLTHSGGFTLNGDVALRNVKLAGGGIYCDSYALSIYDGVTLGGAISGTGSTLNVHGTINNVSIGSGLGQVNVGGVGETPVFTVSNATPLECTGLGINSGSTVNADSVDCSGTVELLGTNAEITVTNTLECASLSVGGGSTVNANIVDCSGTINLYSNALIKVAEKIDTATLESSGGTITYTGNSSCSGNGEYILSIDNDNAFTGNLTITITPAFAPSISTTTPSRIIKVPSGYTIAYNNIELSGELFDNYALGLFDDPLDSQNDYYVLWPVVASVTYRNNTGTIATNKYTSFTDALIFLDTFDNSYNEIPQLNIWQNVELDNGDFPLTGATPRECIVNGHKPGADTSIALNIKTLTSSNTDITLDRNIEFKNINIGMTGSSNYKIDVDGHALTIGDNVSFVYSGSGNPNIITGTSGGSLTVGAGALNFGNIVGLRTVALNGSSGTYGNITGPADGTGRVDITNSSSIFCGTISDFLNVTFTNSTVNCGTNNITGLGSSGNLNISGGTVTCDTISGFANITFGGTTTTIKLNQQLIVSGSLTSTVNTTLEFTSSGTGSANIVFNSGAGNLAQNITGFSGLTVKNSAPTDINHKLIQIPDYSDAAFLAYKTGVADRITLGAGYTYGGGDTFSLRPNVDNYEGYFILSEPVGTVTLTSTSSSVTYGDLPLSFTAGLYNSSGSTAITGWLPDEATIKFYLCDSSGNTLLQQLGEEDVSSGGTATLNVTNNMYLNRLNAGTHYITAVFNNPPDNEVRSPAKQLTVDKKELTVTLNAATPIGTPATKEYDGNTSLLPLGVNPSAFLTLSGGILSGDSVSISSATAYFTNKNATTNTIDYTAIGLNNDNYTVSSCPTGVQTNWEIVPKLLAVNPASVTISKVYDGTTDMSPLSSLSYDPTNLVSGEFLHIVPENPTYSNPNAGNGITINYDRWQIVVDSNAIASNYTTPLPANSPLTGSITKKPLDFTMSASSVTKVYDGNNTVPDLTQISVLGGSITGLIGSESVGINVVSAQFEPIAGNASLNGINANAEPLDPLYNVTADFELVNANQLPASNYSLTESSKTTPAGAGKINKAPVESVDDIAIQIQLNIPPAEAIYQLGNISYSARSWSGGMVPGNIVYSVDNTGTGYDDTFFYDAAGEPSIEIGGNELKYTPREHTDVDTDGSKSRVTIKSQNYADLTVVFHFTATDKTVLTIDGITMPGNRPYNNTAVRLSDCGGSPIFSENGTPLAPQPVITGLIYQFTDENGVPVQNNEPVNAGVYTLWAKIDDDDYMTAGELGSNLGSFEITKRGLTIKPVENETVSLAALPALIANPSSKWGTYAKFVSAPRNDTNGTGLVSGSLSAIFGDIDSDPAPFDVSISNASLGDNRPRTVTITNNLAALNSLIVNGNYTITGYDTATLTITGSAPVAGSFTFDPDLPDGNNGWYISEIIASYDDPSFPFIGLSSTGPSPSDPFFSSSTGVSLGDIEGTGIIPPPLYLADGNNSPTFLTEPYYPVFTYKRDHTAPSLTNAYFDQQGEDWGLLYVTATDATSGIANVYVTVSYSGGTINNQPMYGTGNGIYSYYINLSDINQETSFSFNITAEDNAGNSTLVGLNGTGEFLIADHIKLFYGPAGATVELNDGDTLRMIKDDIAELSAVIYDNTNNPLAGSYQISWVLSAPGMADVVIDTTTLHSDEADLTALEPLLPELAERATLTVGNMGKYITIDLSFCTIVSVTDPVTPNNPRIVLPAGVDSSVVLVIEKLKDVETGDMKDNMRDNLNVLSGFPNWSQSTNSRWLDIYLEDTSGNPVSIPQDENLIIYLPHINGVTAANDYLMIHQNDNDNSLDNLPLQKSAGGIEFSVDSLSPFAMIWKALIPNPPPVNPGGNGGNGGNNGNNFNNNNNSSNNKFYPDATPSGLSGGGGGGGGAAYDDFWYQIRKAIRAAKSGDTVVANVPTDIISCPVSVLTLLKDKDVTLYIKWLDEEFGIYGKYVTLPNPPPSFYLISDLFKKYGKLRPVSIGLQGLQNPETGGDDIMVFAPNGELRLTLPVLPGISKTDRLVQSPRTLPVPPISQTLPVSPAPSVFPDVSSRFSTGLTDAPATYAANAWNIFTVFAILMSLAIMALVFQRGKSLYFAIVSNMDVVVVPAAAKPVSKPMPKTPAAVAMPHTVSAVQGVPAAAKPVSMPKTPAAVAMPRTVSAVQGVPSAAKPVSKPVPKTPAAVAMPRAVSAVQGVPTAAKPVSKPMPKTPAAVAMPRAVSAVQGVPTAAKPVSKPVPKTPAAAATPRTISESMLMTRISAPASLSVRGCTDQKFFSLVDQHRLLQQDLDNGRISKTEYERQKRKLACYF